MNYKTILLLFYYNSNNGNECNNNTRDIFLLKQYIIYIFKL